MDIAQTAPDEALATATGEQSLNLPREFLTNATPAELIAAVHENIYALFRAMQAIPGASLVETERLSYHHAFPPNPMFKGAWRARLAPGEVDEAIDEAIAWFERAGATSFFWWTDPATSPPKLAQTLLDRGFDGIPTGEPGMVADLHALAEVPVPAGLTILQATDQTKLEDWGEAFSTSFGLPASDGQSWVDATLSSQWKSSWRLYVGYLEERPVASSLLLPGAGVAGLYAIGTLPEVRGRGIGTAMTLQPCRDALQEGYHYAGLFASRAGYPLYRRIGFFNPGSQIGIFYYDKYQQKRADRIKPSK